MAMNDSVAALREAIRLSPDNLPLRRLLATSLLDTGRPDEAEVEFRVGLDQAPEDVELKIGLARAFAQQGKKGQCVVVLEEVASGGRLAPGQQVAVARLLYQQGERSLAERLYRSALKAD